jgi:polyhydroxyalkanoate synthesis regulator phasin
MAADERFKKYQEAGADFLETARARAEEFLWELSKAGDSTQRQAQDVVDEMFESSRRGSEQLFGAIRREITVQLAALGLATKDDLAALERRLTGRVAPAKSAGTKASAARKAPARSTGATKKTTGKKAAAKKAPAKRAISKKAAGGT